MNLSNELYRNVAALDAIEATLKAKGRKVKRANAKVEEALEQLSLEGKQELLDLCWRIAFSYNYRPIRLKAVRNQRRNTREYQAARVANFFDNNPEHPLNKGASVRQFNYWERG